jgi:hypothetical protein
LENLSRNRNGDFVAALGRKIIERRQSPQNFLPMQDENLERWQTVCKEVEGEQDPHRFLELTRAILRMLTEKQHRLEQMRAKKKPIAATA